MSETILSALVNGTIISAVLAAVVGAALRAINYRFWNASIRYYIWCVTLAVTIVLPAVYLSLSPIHLELTTPKSTGEIRSTSLAMDQGYDESLPVRPVAAVRSDFVPSRIGARNWRLLSMAPIRIGIQDWMKGVLILWAAVSMFMLGRLAVSWAKLLRESRQARTISMIGDMSPNVWLRRCGSMRQVRLAVSDDVSVPVAAGPGRPAILIPAGLIEQLSNDELEQILIHEAAHFARFDDYTLFFQRIVEALFVFHPMVRWVTSRMSLEREIACDDVVIGLTGRARRYAKCLVRVAELANVRRESLLAPLATNERSELEARVEMLLDDNREPWTTAPKLRLIALLAIFASFAWVASVMPQFVLFSAAPPANAVVANRVDRLDDISPSTSSRIVTAARSADARSAPLKAVAVASGNLGIDRGQPGQTPEAWHAEGLGAVGFQGTVVDHGCLAEGLRCLMIKGAASPDPGWLGHVDTSSVPPGPYLGNTVRFRAAVRVEGDGTSAWMWLRVNNTHGGVTFFKNTTDRPITSNHWNYYSIPAVVAQDSAQISLGFGIKGPGRIWVDDAGLESVTTLEPASLSASTASLPLSVSMHNPVTLRGTPVTSSDIKPGSVDLVDRLGALGVMPKGWRAGGFGAAGFNVTLVDNGCIAEASHCLMIKGAASPVDYWKGQVSLDLPARSYLEQTVRLRTAIRVEGEGTYAWLYMKVNDVHGKTTWMTSTEDRPAISGQWNYYAIPAEVAADSSVLSVSFFVRGTGRVLVDDTRIEPFFKTGTK